MGEETKPADAAPPADEGSKAAPAEEEKKEEQPPAAEEAAPPSPLVVQVELHCVGCAKKMERSILKLRGVEGVAVDTRLNQITVKGVVDPHAICHVIKKKTRRMPTVVSPLPPAEGQPVPQVIASKVSGLVTVELNVNMHCEACALQLRKKILQMRGVQTAETEFSTGQVTVTGTMDADKLVDYVYRRTKKQARIVPQPQPEPEKPPEDPKPADQPENPPPAAEEKKEEGGDPPKEGEAPPEEEPKKEGAETGDPPMPPPPAMHMPLPLPAFALEDEPMKRMMMYQHYYQPTYVYERIPPAPQLFSDENPNACSIS